MKYTYIIWDFNGTLLDDMDACLKSTDRLLGQRGLPQLGSLTRYREVFGFPIVDYYRRAGFDLEREPYEVLAHEWVEQYRLQSVGCGLFEGVKEVLSYFRMRGVRQTVLSASKRETLCEQISALGIGEYFEELWGLDDIYANSKTALGIEWRKRHPGETVLFVGDTVHDAQTAKSMGADCVLVCAGHQTRELLETTALPVFDSIRDLPAFAESNG